MYRVIVKTTSDTVANLEGDRIEEKDEFFKVYNGTDLVGVFDFGSVLFIYKTKANGKGAN